MGKTFYYAGAIDGITSIAAPGIYYYERANVSAEALGLEFRFGPAWFLDETGELVGRGNFDTVGLYITDEEKKHPKIDMTLEEAIGKLPEGVREKIDEFRKMNNISVY